MPTKQAYFCEVCGSPLKQGASFCKSCGTDVSEIWHEASAAASQGVVIAAVVGGLGLLLLFGVGVALALFSQNGSLSRIFPFLANSASVLQASGEPAASQNRTVEPTRQREKFIPTTRQTAINPEAPMETGIPTARSAESFRPTTTNLPRDWRQGHIVYAQRGKGKAWLYYAPLANISNTVTLASGRSESNLLGAALSPDGSQVVYYEYPDTLYQVFVDAPGRPSAIGYCQSPSWGGETQFICRQQGNQLTLFEGNTRSSSLGVVGLLPAWQPNGSGLAYALYEGDNTRIYRTTVSGGAAVLLAGAASENYAPVWSPAGQWIAYQSNEGSANSEIWTMDDKGGSRKRLTHTPGNAWSRGPTWSPDGRWIAYVSNQNGSAGGDLGDIFVISADGGSPEQMTGTGGSIYNWRISWSK